MSREHRAEAHEPAGAAQPRGRRRRRRQPPQGRDGDPGPRATSSPAGSPGRSTRSTPRSAAAPAAGLPVGRRRSPSRSTSPSSPCRPHAVLEVVDECAEAGVKALLVVSSGFAEEGREGARAPGRAASAGRAGTGMRVVGPNSFGHHQHRRRRSTSTPRSPPSIPPRGRFGLFAQSGALGIAVLASAARRNLGISDFGSAGNRVDVSGNDFMQYWIDDDSTDAVGLYLESMGNPRKFSRIARNLALHQAGHRRQVRGQSGSASRPGHRVRATKARPEVFSAMLRQAGVIRVENVHQLFDVAQLVIHQPLPAGRPGGRRRQLRRARAPWRPTPAPGWGLTVTHGPADLRSESTAAEFRTRPARRLRRPPGRLRARLLHPAARHRRRGRRGRRARGRPGRRRSRSPPSSSGCAASTTATSSVTGTGGSARAIPVYSMPEDAVRALAAATRYGQWRAKDRGTPLGAARASTGAIAEDVVETVLSVDPKGRRLAEDEARGAAHRIRDRRVGQARGAHGRRGRRGGRGARLPRRPQVDRADAAPPGRASAGLRIDLRDEPALRAAWASLHRPARPARRRPPRRPADGDAGRPRASSPPTRTRSSGRSSASRSPGCPPSSSATSPTGSRRSPTSRSPSSSPSVKAAPVLHGHRGAAPVHRAALSDLIARVSVLADDLPEVASLVLNPVNAHPGGVEVLGAEIVLAPAPRRTDPGRRSLT